MSGKTRVMLVDDHAVVRMGFRMLLEATDDMTVVAEAETGEAAYQSFQDAAPDVIVMDLAMPGAGGMEAAKRILARDKGARILALSAHEDPSHARHMLKAGALGYLCKRSAPEALIDAIRQIAAGRMYVDAIVAQRMAMQEFRGETNPVGLLSEREFEIFLKLAKGLSVNQIADILTLSPRTVGTHLYNIKQKLNVSNQAEIALIAVRHGLIET
jgi:two-component system, NarL family, invasion response regulator UvrY